MKDLKDFLMNANISNSNLSNQVFVVIKPGFDNIVGEICKMFKDNGYEIIKTKTKRLLLSEAKELYKIHKDEEFYDALCKYMSSGLTTAFMLRKKSKNIFKDFSKLKDNIRKKYGESDMRNVIHSSDSYKNFIFEHQIYF